LGSANKVWKKLLVIVVGNESRFEKSFFPKEIDGRNKQNRF
jgi:hypothetical protein